MVVRSVFSSRCRYCRQTILNHRERSWDHVVPVWAIKIVRLMPVEQRPIIFPVNYVKERRNQVTCCGSCNRSKAGMPVAIFLDVRLKPGIAKRARINWGIICNVLTAVHVHRSKDPVLIELANHFTPALAEFAKPIPEHFVPGHLSIEISDRPEWRGSIRREADYYQETACPT